MCVFNTDGQARVNVEREHAFEAFKVVRVSGKADQLWQPTHARYVNGKRIAYKPGKSYTAHAVPETNYTGVGFHAFRTLAAAKSARSYSDGIVRVRLYGKVVIHGDGYRSEYMDVVGKGLALKSRRMTDRAKYRV